MRRGQRGRGCFGPARGNLSALQHDQRGACAFGFGLFAPLRLDGQRIGSLTQFIAGINKHEKQEKCHRCNHRQRAENNPATSTPDGVVARL